MNSATKRILRSPNGLFLKSVVSMQGLIGVGLLASLALPRPVTAALAAVAILPPLYSLISGMVSQKQSQLTQSIRKGRHTAKIEGDFVVFLIGVNPNSTWELTSNFKKAGDALQAILKELDEQPNLGCLGSESYLGGTQGGSKILLVQYWRSVEHLQKYAASSTNSHHSPWLWLMKLGRESPELGFWHETFHVRAGEYEAIHVNCTPFHLLAARDVTVVPASRSMQTMMGRLGRTSGETVQDWPQGYSP